MIESIWEGDVRSSVSEEINYLLSKRIEIIFEKEPNAHTFKQNIGGIMEYLQNSGALISWAGNDEVMRNVACLHNFEFRVMALHEKTMGLLFKSTIDEVIYLTDNEISAYTNKIPEASKFDSYDLESVVKEYLG